MYYDVKAVFSVMLKNSFLSYHTIFTIYHERMVITMKKIICFIVISLLLGLSSCVSEKKDDISKEKSSEVTQNEQSFENAVIIRTAEIFDDYAVLPLCEVISKLGFSLTWDVNNNATFICDEIEYEISIYEKSLTKKGDKDNYLIAAPGTNGNFICYASNGELMVDDTTLKCLFQTFLKYPLTISIDHNNNCVIIAK